MNKPQTLVASPITIEDDVKPFNPDQDWPTNNAFLHGPYAPWTAETNAYDLEVIGKIPDDLAGALFRTSSNSRYQPRSFERYHWFEGDGMVAGIYLRDGKAAFRTSWVKTDSFKVEAERGEAVYNGFVNGGSRGFLPEGAPQVKNVANTNVHLFDDHLLVYFEGGLPHAMNPESLQTLGTWDFHGGIGAVCTAHFKIDPKTGDMLFFAALGNVVTWYRADVSTGQVVDKVSFDVDIPIFLHDFAVSENYAAFFVTPTQYRADYVLQGRPGVIWDEKALPDGTHVLLLDRRTHRITRHETGNTGAPTHFYNAYEIGEEVVVQGHRTAAMGTPTDRLNNPLSGHEFFGASFPWEWRIDTRTGSITERQMSDVGGDLPRINDAFTGLQNRFGYFTTMKELARHDYGTGVTQIIKGVDQLTVPCEPVFVPRPNAVSEDDGYLLALWYDPTTRLTDLLIHAAADPSGEPLARVKLPARVPAGFHGNWVDQAAIEKSVIALSAD